MAFYVLTDMVEPSEQINKELRISEGLKFNEELKDLEDPLKREEEYVVASKRFETQKKLITVNLKQLGKFKVVLSVYCTKNNICWLITDVTKTQIFYKISGGYTTKRGYLKNSQKTCLQNFELVLEALENLKANYIFCHLNTGIGTKKHPSTSKAVLKILDGFKFNNTDYKIFPSIINTTPHIITPIRLKGGKRGRR